MTSVWYVGRYGKRQLSVGDWAGAQVVVLDMTRDGLHPSTNGHKKIAAGIKTKLQEMVA